MSHFKIAVSEQFFQYMLSKIRNKHFAPPSKVTDLGRGYKYSITSEFTIDNGSIDFLANNTIKIKELDINFLRLDVDFYVKFEEYCVDVPCFLVPWLCTIPENASGASKEFCFYEGSPTYVFSIDLAPFIKKTEISLNCKPKKRKGADQWEVFLEFERYPVDIDLIDVADTVGDLFKNTIKKVAEDNLPGGDLADAALKIIGKIEDLLRKVIDFEDDLREWIVEKIKFDIIFDFLNLFIPFFVKKDLGNIIKIDNPYTIGKEEEHDFCGTNAKLMAVKLPISDIDPDVTSENLEINVQIEDA